MTNNEKLAYIKSIKASLRRIAYCKYLKSLNNIADTTEAFEQLDMKSLFNLERSFKSTANRLKQDLIQLH